MDMQTMFKNYMSAQREERRKTSPQLSLGEYIRKLEQIADKTKKCVFDGEFMPSWLISWRGDYAELSLDYETLDLEKAMTVEYLLKDATEAVGKTYQGYKGGDFVMDKNTSIWVASYGRSGGFKADEENELYYQGLVDVEDGDLVVFKTQAMDT